MVNRRSFVEAILGAGASLVAMVLGKRERQADASSFSCGLEKGSNAIAPPVVTFADGGGNAGVKTDDGKPEGYKFRDREPVVIIQGSGEAFVAFVAKMQGRGVALKMDSGSSTASLRGYVAIEDANAYFSWRGEDGRGRYVEGWRVSRKRLSENGVTSIRSGGLTIDLA